MFEWLFRQGCRPGFQGFLGVEVASSNLERLGALAILEHEGQVVDLEAKPLGRFLPVDQQRLDGLVDHVQNSVFIHLGLLRADWLVFTIYTKMRYSQLFSCAMDQVDPILHLEQDALLWRFNMRVLGKLNCLQALVLAEDGRLLIQDRDVGCDTEGLDSSPPEEEEDQDYWPCRVIPFIRCAA